MWNDYMRAEGIRVPGEPPTLYVERHKIILAEFPGVEHIVDVLPGSAWYVLWSGADEFIVGGWQGDKVLVC